MKPKRPHSRKSASITNSRWLAYATAGAASAFGSAQSAEATIHYSGPINRVFRFSQTSTFQLDQPGDSIRLIHRFGTNYAGYAYFGIRGLAGASIAGFYGSCRLNGVSVSNLTRGQLISSRPFVPAQSGTLAITRRCGQFAGGGIGYIGFKFNNGSGDQYGWVRIKSRRTFEKNFILRDYAYGDVGDRIAAGQKGDQPNDLELESLGGLALGAAGLLAWRKRRSQTTQAK